MIHIIDWKNGIAVFEEAAPTADKRFKLMIAAAKIRNVPIIVNNCERYKQSELILDEPDYADLLKRK